MAGVTSINGNIIEKHYTEEEGVYVENNAEPSLKIQSGKKCRSKLTASFQPQKRRLRFFWKSLCCNTQWPQPHLGSIHHWKQLQKISETLVSSRFPTNLKEAEKEVELQWRVKEKQEGKRCHTIYISFWSGVSTTVMYSAMQSWYCFDWSWSRASMPPGGIAGVCAVIFFVSAATSKKVKTKDSKQENIYSPLRHQSMKAWRDLSQNLSVTAMSRMTTFAMVQKQ